MSDICVGPNHQTCIRSRSMQAYLCKRLHNRCKRRRQVLEKEQCDIADEMQGISSTMTPNFYAATRLGHILQPANLEMSQPRRKSDRNQFEIRNVSIALPGKQILHMLAADKRCIPHTHEDELQFQARSQTCGSLVVTSPLHESLQCRDCASSYHGSTGHEGR